VTLVEADVQDDADRQRCLQAALDIKDELYGAVLLLDMLDRIPGRTSTQPLGFRGLMARDCAETMRRMGTRGAIVHVVPEAVAGAENGVDPEGRRAERSLPLLTRRLAREYAVGCDIRINTVVVGPTGVGRTRSAVEAGQYDAALEHGGLTRLTRPEDAARAIRFLLEPDNHVTGQVLTVDGGLSVRERS
jgi:NAD(P)-dependent dehydrogenase (short-subunit alcohol dehydrogenase family)